MPSDRIHNSLDNFVITYPTYCFAIWKHHFKWIHTVLDWVTLKFSRIKMLVLLIFQIKNCSAPPNFVHRCAVYLVMLWGDQHLNDLLFLTSFPFTNIFFFFSFLDTKFFSKLWVECMKKMATSCKKKNKK